MLSLNVLIVVASAGLAAGQAAVPPAGSDPGPAASGTTVADWRPSPASPGVAAEWLVEPGSGGASEPFATVPPAPSHQGQPADSLYRLARAHLNRGDFRRAAALFRSLVDDYPKSSYAPDALYWQGFALYRLGDRHDLSIAREALQEQRRRFPAAATHGDADALLTRIDGELAREGDADAAESIAEQARAIAEATAANVGIGQISMEAARAGVDAARAAIDATAGAFGSLHDDSLPPECAVQRERNEMRVAALNALLQMDADQALPVLRDVLERRDVCSAPLRRKAVFLVGQKHTPEAESLLLGVLRNDPDRRVREQAVFWLSQVPGDRAVAALEKVLTTSKDRGMQERAVFALSQHHSAAAAAALRRFALDPKTSAEVRERAIFWLGQENSPESGEFLRQMFQHSTSESQKERILFSLSQARSPANDRFLAQVATDKAQPLALRKRALFWASQSGSLTTADLGRLYDTGDRAIRGQVIFALGQRRDGIDKLLDIAKKEKDPTLRSKAIFWLGQSRDPRAVKLLEEILSQ